jgi:hypothetical protein
MAFDRDAGLDEYFADYERRAAERRDRRAARRRRRGPPRRELTWLMATPAGRHAWFARTQRQGSPSGVDGVCGCDGRRRRGRPA